MPRTQAKQDGRDQQDEGHEESDGGSPAAEDAPAELMVVNRQRRANAGNRMAKLLAVEDNDELGKSLYEALEDVPDDDDFGGADAEAPDDISLESSEADDNADDNDPDPPAEGAVEDLEGERELAKQERAERRALKRKAQRAMFKLPAVRKKLKLENSTAGESSPGSATPATRPRKRVERVSWLPSQEDGPVRASLRASALKNRAETHERLREKEKNRLVTVANMRAAEERNKEKNGRRPMTQAERLAEAAKIERQNSKSLNSWEEAERKRAAEQKARLEALKNRKLEGPVIRYWSGPAIWVGDKLKHVGKKWKIEEIREQVGAEALIDSKADTQLPAENATTNSRAETEEPNAIVDTAVSQDQPQPQLQPQPKKEPPPEPEPAPPEPSGTYSNTIIFAPPQGPTGFLRDIHYWASQPEQAQQQENQAPRPPASAQEVPLRPKTSPPPPPTRPVVEVAARTLVILQNFDPLKVRDKDFQRRVLFDCVSAKPSKPPQELCVITSRPARYRDPATGLPYHSAYAYRCIQRLVGGACQWSNLLGSYVGPVYENPVGRPAAGVPERFWPNRTEGSVKQEAMGTRVSAEAAA